MTKEKIFTSIIIIFLISLFMLSCTENDNNSGEPVIVPEIFNSAEYQNVDLYTTESDIYVYHYSGSPPPITIGDVIVGAYSNGKGYLRRITDVEYTDFEIILHTEFVALDEIFRDGIVERNVKLNISPNTNSLPGDSIYSNSITIYNGKIVIDSLPFYEDDNAFIGIESGNIEITPELQMLMDFGYDQLEEFSAELKGDITYSIEFLAHGNATQAGTFSTSIFRIKSLPILIHSSIYAELTFDIMLEAVYDITVSGSYKTGYDGEHSMQVGASYTDQWQTIWEPDTVFNAHPFIKSETSSIHAKIAIVPTVSIEIMSENAPSLSYTTYMETDADIAHTTDWNACIYAGMSSILDFDMGIISRTIDDYNTSIIEPRVTLSCNEGTSSSAAPVAVINSPSNGASFGAGAEITFRGTAYDTEDGYLEGFNMLWTSDRDGNIGVGTEFSQTLSIGNHVITLTAVDSDGISSTDIVVISVGAENTIFCSLTWDTDSTDVDLHLLAPDGTPFSYTDCYFSNRTPDWGTLGSTGDDPSLNVDDVDGYGPENIIIEQPYDGLYTVFIHYYADNDQGSSNPEVQIILNETDTETFGPQTIEYDQIWVVTGIQVTDGVASFTDPPTIEFPQSFMRQRK